VNCPSSSFTQAIQPLKEAILSQFERGGESTRLSLFDWFKKAQGFWYFSGDHKGLYDYSSLKEKKQD